MQGGGLSKDTDEIWGSPPQKAALLPAIMRAHYQAIILLVIPCLFMQYEKILMVWVRITRGWKPSVIRTQTINIVRIAWEQTGGNELSLSKHEFYSKSFENAGENAWKIVLFIFFIMLQSILVWKISRLDWRLCASFLSTSRSTTRCS